jgi:hypothetical protein
MKIRQLKILVAVLVLYIVISSIQRSQNTQIVINLHFWTSTPSEPCQTPSSATSTNDNNAATLLYKIPKCVKVIVNPATTTLPQESYEPTAVKYEPVDYDESITPSDSLRVNARTAVPLSTRKGEVGVYLNKTINIRDYIMNFMETVYYSG